MDGAGQRVHDGTWAPHGGPAAWVPSEGDTTVGITFRVGWADEPPAWRGVSHLVEHALLAGVDAPGLTVAGGTAAYTTHVAVTGPADLVAVAVDGIAERLGAPGWARGPLDARPVLRAEAGARPTGGSLFEAMLVDLVGLDGPARSVLAELGLPHLDEERIRRWVDTWFVAGNAAVWGAGPERPQLDLPLADGPLRPARPIGSLRGASVHSRRAGALGFVGLAGASGAVELASHALARRWRATLRDLHGATYAVDPAVLACGGGRTVAGVLADVSDGAGTVAFRAAVAALADLGEHGPRPDELEAARADLLRPGAGVLAAREDAERSLLGPTTVDDRRRDLLVAGRDDVAAALQELQSEAAWTVPEDAELGAWTVPAIAWPSDERPQGRELAPVDGDDRRLVVGERSLWLGRGSSGVAVDLRRPAAVLAWRDGTRQVVRDDGHTVLVVPWRWSDACSAIDAIDTAAPDDVRAELGWRGPDVPPDAWDVAEDHRSNPAWDPATSTSRLLLLGAVLVGWLDAAGLLRPEVLGPGAPGPDGTPLAELPPVARYRALGGVLAPDMVTPDGRRFVDHLFSGDPRPIDAVWSALGGPSHDGFLALPDEPWVHAAALPLLDDAHHRR